MKGDIFNGIVCVLMESCVMENALLMYFMYTMFVHHSATKSLMSNLIYILAIVLIV